MKTLEEQMALFQSLNVIDDIFFHKIAEDREVCEEILRIILEMPRLKVIQSQVQRFLRNSGAHSVILDVLCELGDGTHADVEVQKGDDDDHQKRVRFNQSNIDTLFTEKGIKYQELPDVYMVFISKFDLFEKGRTIYHIDRIIRETKDVVENGVHEVYVNAAIDDGTEIAELMQYFKKSAGKNKKFAKLCNRVEYFKKKKKGVKIMATLFETYVAEEVAEATAKVTAKAEAEKVEEQRRGIRSTVRAYFKCKYSPEAAKEAVWEEYSGVDEEMIDAIIEEVYGGGK